MPNAQNKMCAKRMVRAGKRNGASVVCMCVQQRRFRFVACIGERPMHECFILESFRDTTAFPRWEGMVYLPRSVWTQLYTNQRRGDKNAECTSRIRHLLCVRSQVRGSQRASEPEYVVCLH